LPSMARASIRALTCFVLVAPAAVVPAALATSDRPVVAAARTKKTL
jgi:hypothetical protein